MYSSLALTSLPAIDASAVNRRLQATHSDPIAFKRVIVDTFTDGSRVACETTACFLIHLAQTEANATAIANIMKPLSTVASETNSRALARIAAKLAVSFDTSACAAPLEGFIYAETFAKRCAFDETIGQIGTLLSKPHPPRLTVLLRRTNAFFQQLLVDADPICRYDVVRALTSLVRSNASLSSKSEEEIGDFLLCLQSIHSPFYELSPYADDDEAFEPFLMSNIANLLPFSNKFTDFVRTIVIRAFDFQSPVVFSSVYKTRPTFVNRAIDEIGVQVFVYMFVVMAATQASRGHFFHCEETLNSITSIMPKVWPNTQRPHPGISSTVTSLCIAIVSLATAAGANEVLNLSTSILHGVRNRECGHDESLSESAQLLSQCEFMERNAVEQKCPATVFGLTLLRALIRMWSTPFLLGTWISRSFSDMMQSRFSSSMPASPTHSMVQDYVNHAVDTRETVHAAGDNTAFEGASCISLSAVAVSLACLHHHHPRVRMGAARALAEFHHPSTMVFCLPSLLVRLQEEQESAVALRLLQDVLVSETLTRHQATSALAIGAILRIVRAITSTDGILMIQACLVAIAKAGRYAPGIATAVLQKEGEKLRGRFDTAKEPERIGISGAILTLTTARPARGANFVPLIAKCITRESVNAAPVAASLCFDAMYVMVQEGILDSTKTVKVVLKDLPNVMDVDFAVRRSFLRLLGCVSLNSSSKKGLVLAEKVIPMLRLAVTSDVPNETRAQFVNNTSEENVLSWSEVGTAAESLTQFTVDEILRIEHIRVEPLLQLESERQRLERIQDDCAAFIERVLTTVSVCKDKDAYKQLQKLLNKVAKHEWDIRPRGAFDPDRIAKLSATADALRRARTTRSGEGIKDPESNSERERFLKGVKSMPSGVIKTLCTHCAKLNTGALRAVALAGAVTTAIPWAPVLDEATKSDQTHVAAAAMNVLWNARIDETEFVKVRSLNIGILRPKIRTPEEIVEIFLGCVQHYEERVPVVVKTVDTTESAEAVLKAVDRVEKGRKRLVAGKNGVLLMERMTGAWENDVQTNLENILFERCFRSCGSDGKIALEELETCATQIRLMCKYDEATVLKEAVNKVACHEVLMEDELLLRDIGKAVSKLSKPSRRKMICEIAERGGRLHAKITCQALGGAIAFPDICRGLTCSLALCEVGERVAILKLRSDMRDSCNS